MKLELLTSWKNCLKCSKGIAETRQHKRYKYLICEFMWENKINFYTEAVFKNNKRADIYILDWNIAVEIMHTEKYSLAKKKKYPCDVLFISTDLDPVETLKALTDLKDINGSNVAYYNKKFNEVKNDIRGKEKTI